MQGHKIGAAQVYNSFGCSGQNISPTLELEQPAGRYAKFCSHGLRSGRAHGQRLVALGLYNIPANVDILPAGAGNPDQHGCRPAPCKGAPTSARMSMADPCPPPGKPHHYHFRLYALKVAEARRTR